MKLNRKTVYDVSITTGVGAVSGGLYLMHGPATALIAFGALVIALSVYAAERLK